MNYSIPLDFSLTSQCSFYEGYYMAFQNMGVFIVKVGLAFFIFDFAVSLLNRFIDNYLENKKYGKS